MVQHRISQWPEAARDIFWLGMGAALGWQLASWGRMGAVVFAVGFPVAVASYFHFKVTKWARATVQRSSVRLEVQVNLYRLLEHPWLEPALNRVLELGRTASPEGLAHNALRFIVHDGLIWSDREKSYTRSMTVVGRLLGTALGEKDDQGDALLEPLVVVHDTGHELRVFLVKPKLNSRADRVFPRVGWLELVKSYAPDRGNRPDDPEYLMLARLPVWMLAWREAQFRQAPTPLFQNDAGRFLNMKAYRATEEGKIQDCKDVGLVQETYETEHGPRQSTTYFRTEYVSFSVDGLEDHQLATAW